MDLILLAVPLFFVLIAVELVADRVRGQRNYRLADSINSLSTGVLSTSTGLLTKGVGLLTYALAWEHLALLRLPAEAWWVWVGAFVLYDFCYYWLHRMGHERNVLWAAHSVHHQSEEYNLTTALRQTSSGFIFSWIFYLPLALLGVPPVVFITVASLNLLYQFWVHTRHVPKLGWLEWVLITPSNHRVHHAQNPRYMDCNYGGVFIFWDRLFGTFQEEDDDEPVIFGVTTPLASWNPLWANLQFYAQLWADARRTGRLWDKLRIWFMPTGWRPADVAAADPHPSRTWRAFASSRCPARHAAAVRGCAVRGLRGAGQLLDGRGRAGAVRRAAAGLGGDGVGFVRVGRGAGRPALGRAHGAAAAAFECAGTVSGRRFGVSAGHAPGLGAAPGLQLAQPVLPGLLPPRGARRAGYGSVGAARAASPGPAGRRAPIARTS
jgi:sterol desaturase/sphingolipid hydroxylase (fatty acid hydroxylase superfamily)